MIKSNEEFYKVYRITAHFRKYPKKFVVIPSTRSYSKIVSEFNRIKREAQYEIENRVRKSVDCGMLSVTTEYYSDYDMVDIKIESRLVSKWEEEDK